MAFFVERVVSDKCQGVAKRRFVVRFGRGELYELRHRRSIPAAKLLALVGEGLVVVPGEQIAPVAVDDCAQIRGAHILPVRLQLALELIELALELLGVDRDLDLRVELDGLGGDPEELHHVSRPRVDVPEGLAQVPAGRVVGLVRPEPSSEQVAGVLSIPMHDEVGEERCGALGDRRYRAVAKLDVETTEHLHMEWLVGHR